ncbi:MAG: ABC transporter ATP-binding protein [Desulfobacteraceae bacterium]
MEQLLSIENLSVDFAMRTGTLRAVNDVNLAIDQGERLGLVGESGAGKSVLGFSVINLISKPGYIASGRILFRGEEISKYDANRMRKIRGNRISMIFQDPMMTLNPVLTIGAQMRETLRAHTDLSGPQINDICIEKLKKVYIASPARRLEQYPHEFSGGMRQRIVIAISLLTSPNLIIADEPTTALDVTIQAEIMDLLLELCQTEQMGLLLITHDLAVVSQVTQRIAVMYAGTIVELGPSGRIIHHPKHPYTIGLLGALPQRSAKSARLNQIPGVMPGLAKIPPGCPFNDRCHLAADICRQSRPALETKTGGSRAACHMVA